MKRKLLAVLLCGILAFLPVSSSLAAYWRVNTFWLKAHEKPDYASTVVDSYRRDFAVTIAQRYSGGWAKVRFRPSGKTAYVQTRYLQSSSSSASYVSKDATLLREGPSTSFRAKAKLGKGTKVTVLTHGSAFDYVSTLKGNGYIRNSCLSASKPADKSPSDSKAAHIRNPRRRTVNLRKGPGKGYAVIAEYRPGTEVTVLKRGSSWSKVSVRGRTGYIMTRYLALD